MLYLITGQNGGGKTLFSIRKMHECHAQGLTVYASNFNNLRVPFAKHFPDPNEWPLLPEGSVLFVDEAWMIWPKPKARQATPENVEQLKIHRQGGIDIYLISPGPGDVHPAIRELLAGHYHCIAYGPSQSRIFRFSEYQDDPQSVTARRNAAFEVYSHEKRLYDMYDSSSRHIDKPKPPLRQRLTKLLFVLAGLISLWIAYEIYDWVAGGPSKKPQAQGQGQGAAASWFPSLGRSRAPLTTEQYLQVLQPRIAEMPGSAPIFDERKVQAEPGVFCMASGNPPDSCTCLTEQGTRYLLKRSRCILLARFGPPYDPFKRPPREARQGASRLDSREPEAGSDADSDHDPPGTVVASSGPVAAYGQFRPAAGKVSSQPDPQL